jgi:ATP-dependent DNA ligase
LPKPYSTSRTGPKFYSDYTFGVWREAPDGAEELVPVGKAYHGFTDEEPSTR